MRKRAREEDEEERVQTRMTKRTRVENGLEASGLPVKVWACVVGYMDAESKLWFGMTCHTARKLVLRLGNVMTDCMENQCELRAYLRKWEIPEYQARRGLVAGRHVDKGGPWKVVWEPERFGTVAKLREAQHFKNAYDPVRQLSRVVGRGNDELSKWVFENVVRPYLSKTGESILKTHTLFPQNADITKWLIEQGWRPEHNNYVHAVQRSDAQQVAVLLHYYEHPPRIHDAETYRSIYDDASCAFHNNMQRVYRATFGCYDPSGLCARTTAVRRVLDDYLYTQVQ